MKTFKYGSQKVLMTEADYKALFVKLSDDLWLIPCNQCLTQVEAHLNIPEYIRCPKCGDTVRTND